MLNYLQKHTGITFHQFNQKTMLINLIEGFRQINRAQV